MDVVRVVRALVERIGRRALEVLLVDRHRALVGVERAAVLADAVVDVRRHVDDVPRARHQRAEALGGRERAFGRRRRLDRVDVEVDRAGMVRACA